MQLKIVVATTKPVINFTSKPGLAFMQLQTTLPINEIISQNNIADTKSSSISHKYKVR